MSDEGEGESSEDIETAKQIVANIQFENALAEDCIREIDNNAKAITHEPNPEVLRRIETSLSEILQKETTENYSEQISQIKGEKIAWVQSAAFADRIRNRGASEEDVDQVRNWVISNLEGIKITLLSREDYRAFVKGISEYAREAGHPNDSPLVSEGIHTSQNLGCPPKYRESVFVMDKADPAMRRFGTKLTERLLRHEMGHGAQDGLLESELFQNFKPNVKEGAPDPEYVGQIREVDVRIRALFTDLRESYDPMVGPLTSEHMQKIHEQNKHGKTSQDTSDLLNHFEDDEIIRLANSLPAI